MSEEPIQKLDNQTTHERQLRRRVKHERERRGMSYEALAKAVTEAGCHMNPSTPFKIEKAKPPRRITVDEFIAFAKVFDLTLDELLIPPEVVEDEAVSALLARWDRVYRESHEPINELSTIWEELSGRLGGPRQAGEILRAHIDGMFVPFWASWPKGPPHA